ncbi:MAG: DNA/RNA non-specific endonuclease, partial [Rhodospirillaceae bacterium]
MKISLVALALIALSATNVSADSGNACQDMFRFTGMPEYSGPMENHVIRCRSGYVLLNNGNTRVPDWVLEVLTEERLQGDAVRKDNFRNDTGLDANGTAVAAAEVAEKKDYVGSGYDRGHNAPAADMAWDQGAMDESFFMTNMAPQVGIGFNRYIWKHLEAYVRDLTKERGPLVAITGPIY